MAAQLRVSEELELQQLELLSLLPRPSSSEGSLLACSLARSYDERSVKLARCVLKRLLTRLPLRCSTRGASWSSGSDGG
jgi:hypothetical protein